MHAAGGDLRDCTPADAARCGDAYAESWRGQIARRWDFLTAWAGQRLSTTNSEPRLTVGASPTCGSVTTCGVVDASIALNLVNWNQRVPMHVAAYGLDAYITDPTHLSSVIRFDSQRLGDLSGLRGIHLQCHLGTDTVSLTRLGATMTGLDFSADAIREAQAFATAAHADVTFVEAEVAAALTAVGAGSYDFVYTGIGALCWLPRIAEWASVVAGLLKPGGRLFLREAHPVLWALADPGPDGLLVLEHPYRERETPIVWDDDGTYVETDAKLTATTTHEWNHGLGEIVSALFAAGMRLTALEEHDSIPWDALPGLMEQLPNGEYRLRDRPWRLPHTYTLQAIKLPAA
ncbi:MAG: methyltransferase family protein [Frankiales bacterium]|nr:methyltransferase family protein [Frankiales bacterium]